MTFHGHLRLDGEVAKKSIVSIKDKHCTKFPFCHFRQEIARTKLERVWRKGNPLTLLVGMQTSTVTMENSVEIP